MHYLINRELFEVFILGSFTTRIVQIYFLVCKGIEISYERDSILILTALTAQHEDIEPIGRM